MFLLPKVFTLIPLSITRDEEIYLNLAAISEVEAFRDGDDKRNEKLINFLLSIAFVCPREGKEGKRERARPFDAREKFYSLGTFAINMLCVVEWRTLNIRVIEK